jgi:superfamily II DNA/RNA helicase
MDFSAFALDSKIMEAISYMGYKQATPIQEQAIPVIMEGRDLIACAQTGSGKTAAFILPVLHQLSQLPDDTGTHTLVLVPTRELAMQVDQQIQGFAYFTGASSIAVYGGGEGWEYDQEKKALSKGASIIVATPGRLISHLNMGYVKFDTIKTLILDEADRMLDIGFYEDIIKIISFLPKERQTLMFSATMPPKIRALSQKILKSPASISLEVSKPATGVLQAAYLVTDAQKIALIRTLIAEKPHYHSILIFTATKKRVSEITNALRKHGIPAEGISSNLEQAEREAVLLRFRARKTRVLVATDVLSRGIDIKEINLIINYDVPNDAEDYVHRVGRTARADTTGVAITLVNQADRPKLASIEKLIERKISRIQLPALK